MTPRTVAECKRHHADRTRWRLELSERCKGTVRAPTGLCRQHALNLNPACARQQLGDIDVSNRTVSAISVLAVALAVFWAPAGASAAKSGNVLHVTWSVKVAGDATCDDYQNPQVCTGVFTADVHSNLSRSAGTGVDSFVITAVNGSLDPCNRFNETTVFVFPEGTITVHSDHVDCPAWIRPFPAGDDPGSRIDTTFVIEGGTGAFEGATGSGTEHGFGGGRQGSIIYQGTIFF
jgi:hypothetical protein